MVPLNLAGILISYLEPRSSVPVHFWKSTYLALTSKESFSHVVAADASLGIATA
jgi:hypothetical protein